MYGFPIALQIIAYKVLLDLAQKYLIRLNKDKFLCMLRWATNSETRIFSENLRNEKFLNPHMSIAKNYSFGVVKKEV